MSKNNKDLENLQSIVAVLKDKIANYYAIRAQRIDKRTTDDNMAVRLLTNLETQEISSQSIIEKFVDLAEQFL